MHNEANSESEPQLSERLPFFLILRSMQALLVVQLKDAGFHVER